MTIIIFHQSLADTCKSYRIRSGRRTRTEQTLWRAGDHDRSWMLWHLDSLAPCIREDFKTQPERIGKEMQNPSNDFQNDIILEWHHCSNGWRMLVTWLHMHESCWAIRERREENKNNECPENDIYEDERFWLVVCPLPSCSFVRPICVFISASTARSVVVLVSRCRCGSIVRADQIGSWVCISDELVKKQQR